MAGGLGEQGMIRAECVVSELSGIKWESEDPMEKQMRASHRLSEFMRLGARLTPEEARV